MNRNRKKVTISGRGMEMIGGKRKMMIHCKRKEMI